MSALSGGEGMMVVSAVGEGGVGLCCMFIGEGGEGNCTGGKWGFS